MAVISVMVQGEFWIRPAEATQNRKYPFDDTHRGVCKPVGRSMIKGGFPFFRSRNSMGKINFWGLGIFSEVVMEAS
ncbi:MAG: hypothetical protein BA874_10690 [Desulfuromonadales bacterium C00003068]|nr:MAG: hypothetical protein BA874_10690 [Desulfuromonadales bacterium C00003068]